jgi:hypothetical protein
MSREQDLDRLLTTDAKVDNWEKLSILANYLTKPQIVYCTLECLYKINKISPVAYSNLKTAVDAYYLRGNTKAILDYKKETYGRINTLICDFVTENYTNGQFLEEAGFCFYYQQRHLYITALTVLAFPNTPIKVLYG